MSGLSGFGWLSRHSGSKKDHASWEDDFWGDALKDEWDAVVTGTGVLATPDGTGEQNGTLDLQTGATTGGTSLLRFNRTHFLADRLAIIEMYLKISDVSEATVTVGFRKDADEYAYFRIPAGAIFGESDDGGVEGPYSADSGEVMADDTYRFLAIELLSTETARFYVDGVLELTGTVGAVTADLMDAYIYIVNTSNNNVVLTLDYVRFWQKRV